MELREQRHRETEGSVNKMQPSPHDFEPLLNEATNRALSACAEGQTPNGR